MRVTKGYIFIAIPALMIFISCQEQDIQFDREACLEVYEEMLITPKELVNDRFYATNKLNEFETVKIDTSENYVLKIKYEFKFEDTVSNFFFLISTLIAFEETEEDAKSTLRNWEFGYKIGWGNGLTSNNIDIVNMNGPSYFGKTSNFRKYEKNGQVKGYYLSGRTRQIVYLHAVVSGHLAHHDYPELLRLRVNKINQFERLSSGKGPITKARNEWGFIGQDTLLRLIKPTIFNKFGNGVAF